MSKLKDFSSYGSEASQPIKEGQPLTLEHLNKVMQDVRDRGHKLRTPVIGAQEHAFLKEMYAKGEKNWTEDERIRVTFIHVKIQAQL